MLAEGACVMCIKKGQIGLVLIGAGVGLLASLALEGWFLLVLIAAALLVSGAALCG